jgi:hypothetical protein
MLMKSVVFWVITRRRVVIIYRRFGTTYRSHLHGSRFQVGKKACNKETGQHVSPPRYAVQFLCYRLSFLLGILTREDGTDTLSRNVGK